MPVSAARKDEALVVIRQHLLINGSKDWPPVFEEFKDIQPTTMWRWIANERKRDKDDPLFIAAGTTLEVRLAAQTKLAKHLPPTPKPGALTPVVGEAVRQLDFAVEIPKLYSDAEKLRAYSVTLRTDDSGATSEHIKNPMAFERSIARRSSLIETSLKILQEIWDLRKMQQFYDIVLDEIGFVSPELQQRVITRLSELSNKHGMNSDMRA